MRLTIEKTRVGQWSALTAVVSLVLFISACTKDNPEPTSPPQDAGSIVAFGESDSTIVGFQATVDGKSTAVFQYGNGGLLIVESREDHGDDPPSVLYFSAEADTVRWSRGDTTLSAVVLPNGLIAHTYVVGEVATIWNSSNAAPPKRSINAGRTGEKSRPILSTRSVFLRCGVAGIYQGAAVVSAVYVNGDGVRTSCSVRNTGVGEYRIHVFDGAARAGIISEYGCKSIMAIVEGVANVAKLATILSCIIPVEGQVACPVVAPAEIALEQLMELIVKSMLEKPCQEAIMNYYKSAQNGQLEIVCQIGENRYPKTVPHHFGESEPIEIPVNEESAAVYSRWENTISGPRNSTQVWLHCVPLNRAISYEIFGPDGTRLASQLKYANGSELYDFTSNPDVTDCGMFHVRVKTKNLTWGKFDSLPDAYYPGEPGFCDPGRRKLAISNYSTAGWRIDGNSLSVWDGGDNNTDVSAGGGTMQITFDGELSGNAVREIVVAEYMLGAGNEVSCNVNCEQDGAKWSLSCPAECKFYTVNCFDRRDLTFLMGRLQLDVTTGRGASHVTAVWVPDYVPKCKDGHSVWVPSGQICSFDAPGSAVRTRMCADFGR